MTMSWQNKKTKQINKWRRGCALRNKHALFGLVVQTSLVISFCCTNTVHQKVSQKSDCTHTCIFVVEFKNIRIGNLSISKKTAARGSECMNSF